MATITVDDRTINIELTFVETLGCGLRSITIPRDDVVEAHVVDRPLDGLRGVRAPGIGLPRTIAIGRWRHRGGKDLVVVRRGERAVQLDLAPVARFRRIVVGADQPEHVVEALERVAS